MKCDWRREQYGYLYRKRFDSKIAEANRNRWNRVFRNVGIYNSDAGELPKRKHDIFRTRRKFEIKKISMVCKFSKYKIRLPEDDANASKHVGVRYKNSLLIYMLCIGLNNTLYKLHGTCIKTVVRYCTFYNSLDVLSKNHEKPA